MRGRAFETSPALHPSAEFIFSELGSFVFTLGYTTASISPKPLWIENQISSKVL